jgi:hypothetical protein
MSILIRKYENYPIVSRLGLLLYLDLGPHGFWESGLKKSHILDSHPNGLDFIGILTHKFLESRNPIKLLGFFLSLFSNP